MQSAPSDALDLRELRKVWETLGREDPLWAIASRPDKRGGRWTLEDFLATGTAEVARFRSLIQNRFPDRVSFNRVLDFGCGVGRLSLAWREHATEVVGIDISGPMIEQARKIAGARGGLRFEVNTEPHLRLLPDAAFDLCFSHICLQHMPWTLAEGYIREFARLCAPTGLVLFQLPSRAPEKKAAAANFRQRLVDALPFGLGKLYRRLRHGSSAVFQVYFTPAETVEATLRDAGLTLVDRAPDDSAGPETEGFIYLARKN
jgi:SAM-dependent methyltransferase